MSNARRTLPPLRTLLAFEAVARLGTFTAAARELHVSQAAISQKVRELEAWLGGELVIRSRPTLSITRTGLEVADSIRSGVTTIGRALEMARGPDQRRNQVALATTNTFALYWLGARIQTFYAAYPDIELSLITSDREVTASRTEFDLGVTFATEPPSGYRSKLLLETEVVAVASPAYLETRPAGLEPAQWSNDVLLHMDPEPWLEWSEWLRSVGLPEPPALRANYYSNYITLMQAMLAGRGMGLGWRVLVDPLLQSGELVPIGARTLRSSGAYYLLWNAPIDAAVPSGIRALHDWFVAFADNPGEL